MHRLLLVLSPLAFMLVAATSMAQIIDPPPANSTIPAFVSLVASDGVAPDSVIGHVTVTVRDFANNPVPGSFVVFDFSGLSDLHLAANPLDPRLFVNCSQSTVRAVTNAAGVASFTIMGSGNGGLPVVTSPKAKIYADGVLLGSVPVSIYDLDGQGGVSITDLAFWGRDFFSGTNPGRSDYDGSGAVTIADLSRWASAFFGAHSTVSAAPCQLGGGGSPH